MSIKLCKDCKWLIKPERLRGGMFLNLGGLEFARCGAPQNQTLTDYITGKTTKECVPCKAMRDVPPDLKGYCGPQARWFKPRKKP